MAGIALQISHGETGYLARSVDDWVEGVRTRRYLNYGDYFGVRGISEDLQAEQHITPLPPVWLRRAIEHDQPTALAAVPLPVLILAGEADWRVPPSEAEALAGALSAAARSAWELHQLPGVNHHLVIVEGIEAGFLLEETEAYAEERRPVAPVSNQTQKGSVSSSKPSGGGSPMGAPPASASPRPPRNLTVRAVSSKLARAAPS